ncbi:MAG TPA: JAB domain-containing protein [Hanamia sp.]|nr:JAB domain-containing protein [Hanamia sp.]
MEQQMNLFSLNMVAEVELVYKSKVKPSERPLVKSAKECYELLRVTWDENKIEFVEQFKVVLLNRAQRVSGIYELSTGGVTGTVADPKLIFMAALKANACNIILSHNHPSGNLKPSRADEELTKRIATAGIYLDIKVIDHIIVTNEGYYSFADEGLI